MPRNSHYRTIDESLAADTTDAISQQQQFEIAHMFAKTTNNTKRSPFVVRTQMRSVLRLSARISRRCRLRAVLHHSRRRVTSSISRYTASVRAPVVVDTPARASEISKFASRPLQELTFQQLFGFARMSAPQPKAKLQSAAYLQQECPVRLAKAMVCLENFPYGALSVLLPSRFACKK